MAHIGHHLTLWYTAFRGRVYLAPNSMHLHLQLFMTNWTCNTSCHICIFPLPHLSWQTRQDKSLYIAVGFFGRQRNCQEARSATRFNNAINLPCNYFLLYTVHCCDLWLIGTIFTTCDNYQFLRTTATHWVKTTGEMFLFLFKMARISIRSTSFRSTSWEPSVPIVSF